MGIESNTSWKVEAHEYVKLPVRAFQTIQYYDIIVM